MLGVILGWLSFGTWMYDVAVDNFVHYNNCLTALYSLMLAFNCVIDGCCHFFMCATYNSYSSKNEDADAMLFICGGIFHSILSCIYLGLVIEVIVDS